VCGGVGCLVVSLGLYLARSKLWIRNSQLPVGCTSTCRSVGWTSMVALIHSFLSIFCCQGFTFSGVSKPCLSRLARSWSAVCRERSGLSFHAFHSWILLGNMSFNSSGSQVDFQVTCMSFSSVNGVSFVLVHRQGEHS